MTAPIREAFVVAGDPRPPVAGVPLLLRTLLVLQRAGIERLTVIGTPPPADPRIRVPVGMAARLNAPADDALRLVVGPGAVIDAVLVHDLQAHARPGEVLVSQDVVDASHGIEAAFTEIGPVELKGVSGAVRLHAAHRQSRSSAVTRIHRPWRLAIN